MSLLIRKVSFILTLVSGLYLFSDTTTAQDDYFVLTDYKALQESYFRLGDSLLKTEIGSFTFIGSILDVQPHAGLREFDIQYLSHDSLLLLLDDYRIYITASRFRTFEHQLGFVPGERYLRYIDGNPYWGYNGRVPNRKLGAVFIDTGNEYIELPYHSYADLFEPNLCRKRRFLIFNERINCYTRAFLSADTKRLYIHMSNSREPLKYEVTWIIRNGRYAGRIVDYAH